MVLTGYAASSPSTGCGQAEGNLLCRHKYFNFRRLQERPARCPSNHPVTLSKIELADFLPYRTSLFNESNSLAKPICCRGENRRRICRLVRFNKKRARVAAGRSKADK